MLPLSALPLVALILSQAGYTLAAPTETFDSNVPSAVPSNASPRIDPSFPGFAFEEESFYLYATDEQGKPNTFSLNLIKDVLKRTGGVPILRVGGTSGDKGRYNATQTQPTVPDGRKQKQLTKPPYLSVGPSFFKAFQNFPGCQYIFMVPFFHLDLQNTLEWAAQGLKNIPSGSLNALEIGNEPVNYPWNSGPPKYVSEYLRFEQALIQQSPALGKQPSFQALDVQSGNISGLTVAEAFNDGINKNGHIKQVAYHYYEGSDHPGQSLSQLQANVVNHTLIKQHLHTYQADIDFLQKNDPNIPFVMSEVGNTLGNMDLKQRNQLATALWNVDWQLQCMAIGVSRVNMQQIFYPGYAMWEPQPGGLIPAGVLANYYSQPLIGDFIGTSNSTRVAELTLQTHASPETMSGYAAYDNGKLARIALVNMHLWATGSGARPEANITLTGLPNVKVTAQYLTAPEGAYANDTLTYGGNQWQYPSGQPKQVKQDTRQLQVQNGRLVVSVDATSAVLLTLG